MGLLDLINGNPELSRAVEEQRALAQRVADHFGVTLDEAIDSLNAADIDAFKMFAIGNTIPRELLH